MINLITGVPGAGKTYFSVNIIYKELVSKDSKYSKIYTNINLDFKKCNKLKNDFVFPLDLDDFLSCVEEDYNLSQLFKKNKLFDYILPPFSFFSDVKPLNFFVLPYSFELKKVVVTDYDKYLEKIHLFKSYKHSLIILDECHLYFSSSLDDKLIRFLSYHRHFDIDMYLVTQNKSLINRKYLAFIENMYIGQNPSKRLFSKTFVYKLYASFKEYKANYVGKERLKFDSKIASLYNSGSNKINKSFSRRLLIPFFIVLVVSVLFFIAFRNYISSGSIFGSSTSSNVSKKHNVFNSSKSKVSYTRSYSNTDSFSQTHNFATARFYYKFTCFKFKCIVNQKYIISRNFFNFIKKHSNVYSDVIVYPYETIYLSTNFDLSKFFKRGTNEMDSNFSNRSSIFG